MECSSTSTDDDSDRRAPVIARVRAGGGERGEGGLKCTQEEARSRESRSESYKEPGWFNLLTKPWNGIGVIRESKNISVPVCPPLPSALTPLQSGWKKQPASPEQKVWALTFFLGTNKTSFSVFYFWTLWFQITQNSFYNLTKPTVSPVQSLLLGGGAAHNQCEKKFMTLLFELPQNNTTQHPGKSRTNWENCYKLWPKQCRIWHLAGENNRTHFVACCRSALCFLNFFNCLRFTFVVFTSDDAMLYDGEERWKNRQ